MNPAGKKINFLGDSITAGVGVSDIERVYWKRLERECSLALARGYGVSGTRFASQTLPSREPTYDMDFYTRAMDMDPDADIVAVFGGTNDFGHGDAPIGTMEDRDGFSFYGACHRLFALLIEKYPQAVIIIMTPLHRLNEDDPMGDGIKPRPTAPLSRYREIIIEVARYYSLPVLDLYSVSGIQPRLESSRQRLCPDGLHPNDEGHRLICERLKGFLQSL